MQERLLISFSGGETSGYMTWWILNFVLGYDKIVVVFANTGEEWEATLEFVHECDKIFGFETVWIEGVQYPGERRSPGFRIVDFDTASRDGRPFEDSIAKYGIPNQKFKDCTRNMKRKPIEAYARSIGWEDGSYDLAIGIRADEIDRMTSDFSRRIIYPFIKYPRTKPQVNYWWSQQSFRLRLRGYQGNCKWCWKKSMRKHLTIIKETPEVYEFPRRMEKTFAHHGPEFLKDPSTRRDPLPSGYKRTFFRGNMSVEDLFLEFESKKNTFTPADDDKMVFDEFLDIGEGCEESCEVYSDEELAVEDEE